MKRFTNTAKLRERAIYFMKHGRYCPYDKWEPEYKQFWDEETKRCLYGFENAEGVRVTGKHYFYLNYVPIERLATQEELKNNPKQKTVVSFPRFFAEDYQYFWVKEIAENGIGQREYEDLQLDCKPKYITGGWHLCVLKTRRGGFSYKEAADGVWIYNFIRGSKCHYFAATEEYLTSDAIFNKVESMLNFLNEHTAWAKKRQKKNDMYYKRASYIDPVTKVEKGYMSELHATTVDKPDKVRGKSGNKLTFEEGGSFPNVLDAITIARNQIEQGGIKKGLMTIFGTGGNRKDDGLHGLATIFNKPEANGFLPFENIWDPDYAGTYCGYFVPTTAIQEDCMDEDGNLDMQKALKKVLDQREKWAKLGLDDSTITKRKCEDPLTPSESLNRMKQSRFDIGALNEQLRRLESGKVIGYDLRCELFRNPETDALVIDPKPLDPLDMYPVVPDTGEHRYAKLTGCVRLWQTPTKVDGQIPKKRYFIVVDPYSQDNSPNSKSIGAIYVIKKKGMDFVSDTFDDNIVASYIGRPESLHRFCEILFMLAELYNAKIQSEIQGGGQVIIEYARNNRLEKWLEYTPDIFDKNIQNKKTRSYFITVTTQMKELAIEYLNDWLNTPVGIVDGKVQKRIFYIYDIGLLKELISFDPSLSDGNWDRVSSMMLAVIMLREYHNVQVRAVKKARAEGEPLFGALYSDEGNNLFETKSQFSVDIRGKDYKGTQDKKSTGSFWGI
jgi:hypothetical protein